jgi:anaerobic magnesium-protoporphyrin IX monomethyl ester cyclase
MKVLVVNPPAYNKKDFIREGRCMQTKSSWAALWMPLSLCYISAMLRKDGHEVQLIDCIAEKMNESKFLDLCREFVPEMVVLNTAIPSIPGDMKTASAIKATLPAAKIAIVGMFPSLYEKECLERFQQIDFAIMDEPEWAVSDLASALSGNKALEKVRGLIFRKVKEIIVNERQNLWENNLDDLPFPARDLLNNDAYRLPTNRKRFTLLSVGRGCSEKCIYCVANLYYGKRFRKRSVESVIREIEECTEKYDIRNFLFWGESFTTDPEYGAAICDEIIKRNINIIWSSTSRVDTLNKTLLDKMKRAGCILLGLGIESYNQEVLNRARKRITVEQIDAAVDMVRSVGIKSMGHFVFGLPGDTRESAFKTIDFACRNLSFAQFYCAIPYPKTEFGKIAAEQNRIIDTDYTQFELTRSVSGNENLSPRAIKKIRDYAYRRFYFRPKMIIRTLREVESFRALFSVLNFMDWIKPGKTK